MNIRNVLMLAILAAALYGGWHYYNAPAMQVARTLRAAARSVVKSGAQSAVTDALAAQQGAGYFAQEVALKISGIHDGDVARENIRTVIAYARNNASSINIALSDINVTLHGDKQAAADLTARFNVTADGENNQWFQEFKVGLARSEVGGVWQICSVESVESVKWPGAN